MTWRLAVAGFVLMFSLSAAVPAAAGVIAGQVVAISDGDTLAIFDGQRQHRVRLAEIDAPERKQAFGSVSRQHLARLCFRAQARVHVQDFDRYGRVVGRVTCGRTDANAAMVEAGLAWVYRRYARDLGLFQLERRARAARLGLWRDPAPVAPWDFRHGR